MAFPDEQGIVNDIVNMHRQAGDQVSLALYYAPAKASSDVYLLEVLKGFGSNEASVDKEFMEVTYEPMHAEFDSENPLVHLVLTNPVEITKAVEEGWKSVAPIRKALVGQRFSVIFQDQEGGRILETLQSAKMFA